MNTSYICYRKKRVFFYHIFNNYQIMKKVLATLIFVLMSAMVSMPVSATTGNKNDVNDVIPQNIIVKQTTHFNDGRTLVIYYKKQGMQCEVYSPCDKKNYSMKDASKIESTNFEVVDKTEGKLYRKATLKEIMNLARQLMN